MKITFYLLLLLLTTSCTNPSDTKKQSTQKTDSSIVSELEKAGFFSLIDSDKIEEAKKAVNDSYKDNYFGCIYDIDNRFYFLDEEELFELDGLVVYLTKAKKTFEKLGLKLEIANENNHEETFTGNYWKHTVELNGKEYIAFEGKTNEYTWFRATIYFVEMLNDQLKLQNSEERVYIIGEGNSAEFVFLTPKIMQVVKKYYPEDENFPQSVEELKNWVP